MVTIADYVKKHDLLVCVDSDGCAMDTMNIKHLRCFGPYKEFLITVLIIALICIAVSAVLVASYLIFQKFPQLTGKIGATLKDTKHKKNVTYHTRREKLFVKDVTHALYAYTLNGKVYRVKMTHLFCTKNQAPYMIPIVYIKKFPRIRYINLPETLGNVLHLIYGIIFGFTGIGLLIAVIEGFIKIST